MTYYNRDGTLADSADWALFSDSDRRVAQTLVTDRVDPSRSFNVSTVFLGIDHSFGEGPPLIFESMAFPVGSWDDLLCERYSTEAQARVGHAVMVGEIARRCTDPSVRNPGHRMLNQLNKETAPCSRDTPTAPDG